MISSFNTWARSNLEFPLTRHHFSICSWYFQSSKEACFIMHVDYLPSLNNLSTYSTVKWALFRWESFLWPSLNFCSECILCFKDHVFLFNTEPRFFVRSGIEYFLGKVPIIGICRLQFLVLVVFPFIGLTQYQYVVTASERIWEIECRLQYDLRVLSDCLVGGGAIIIPVWYLIQWLNLLVNSSALGAAVIVTIYPDVLCYDLFVLYKLLFILSILFLNGNEIF